MRQNQAAILAILLCLLGVSLRAEQRKPTRQQYRSPNTSFHVLIETSKSGESKLLFRDASGRRVARDGYLSDDGEHGYSVVKAAWTPDSRFFVYSLESSGGHSPWHSPVQVFDSKQEKIFSLDDALNDAVMNPEFKIVAPDKVTVELYFSGKEVTVSLSSLQGKLDKK